MPKNNLLKSGVILSVCLLTALFAPEVYGNQLLLFNFLIFITLTQGVNIIYGFTGYLPFGYSGFFGLGAYGFAVSVMHISLNIPLAILIGVLASIVVSIILIPLLRLSGPYFAIANMTVALALMEIVSNPALEGLTRGPYGVSLTDVFTPDLTYYVAVAMMVVTVGIVCFFRYSRFGLSIQAVRDDNVSAAAAGINITACRTIAWLLSAGVAGLAGAVFAWYVSVFYAENVFSLTFSIFAIVFALVGGVGTILGPIIGVVLLYGFYNYIGISNPQFFQLIYGVLIMLTVLFLPNGITSLASKFGTKVP